MHSVGGSGPVQFLRLPALSRRTVIAVSGGRGLLVVWRKGTLSAGGSFLMSVTTTDEGSPLIDALTGEGWLELPSHELESLRSTMVDTVLTILAGTETRGGRAAGDAGAHRVVGAKEGGSSVDQQVLLSAAVAELMVIDDALHLVRSASLSD